MQGLFSSEIGNLFTCLYAVQFIGLCRRHFRQRVGAGRSKSGISPGWAASAERETGIELSRATLDDWVMRVGDLLRPISAAMGQELMSGSYNLDLPNPALRARSQTHHHIVIHEEYLVIDVTS
jgi:hypothetical protein